MPAAHNYQADLDKILAALPSGRAGRRLLLHACCAPCSSYVLEYLSPYFYITLYFYNPNISDRAEYIHRLDELRRLTHEMALPRAVEVVDGGYCPERFAELATGYEDAPERGARCQKCIRHRLEESFRFAGDAYDFVGTTLSISPHKDAQFINRCGLSLARKCRAPWLPADFKKRGGFQRSLALSRQYCLYRQNFCGCAYSKKR